MSHNRSHLFGNRKIRQVLLRVFTCSTSLAALAVGSIAQAQDDVSRSFGIEDIIVTAQKREQNVQDVPIAITALSSETLQANRVQSVNDLTGLAPGLLSRQNAGSVGSPSFAMRGVFASASAPSQDRQISVYLDGVYLGGTRGSAFDLPDVERIEVLRGPQGTLFGRNSTAGAISVVSRDPVGKLKWRQEVTVGNYDQLRVRTTIDTPQFGAFSAYGTYVHDERRGDVRNLGAGTTFDYTSPFTNVGRTSSPKWLGSKNSESFFGAIKFAPSDSFSMVYKFDSASTNNTPEARVPSVINTDSFLGSLLADVLAAQPPGGGAYGLVALDPSNRRPKATNNAWTQPGFLKASGHSVTTNLVISDSVSIKNISSYRESEVYGPSSIAGLSGLEFTPGARTAYGRFVAVSTLGADFFALSPADQAATSAAFAGFFAGQEGQYFAGYEGNNYGKGKQYSSETQLNYSSDFLEATVGALWYHSKELNGGLPGMAPNFAFAPVPSLLPLGNLQDGTSISTSIAAYLQGEFHITPQLDIVAGGRITKDKKRGNLIAGGVFTGNRTGEGTIVSGTGAPDSPPFSNFPFNFKKTKPTFSLGVNYKPNDDILLYGKVSTAFLSGGAVGQISFEPETVFAQEVGIKSELLDRRLRVNIALWNAKYKHAQSAQSGSNVTIDGVNQAALGVVVIDNGQVEAKGFEIEIVAAPVDGLTLGASVGYTNAKSVNPNPYLTEGQPYRTTGIAPWIGATNATYLTQPLFADATMLFRVDANYQGKFRSIANPNIENVIPVFAPYEFSKARWIVNGRIALRDIPVGTAKGEIGLWGRNLTNNRDALYQLQFGDILMNSSFQPARTYGLDFIVTF